MNWSRALAGVGLVGFALVALVIGFIIRQVAATVLLSIALVGVAMLVAPFDQASPFSQFKMDQIGVALVSGAVVGVALTLIDLERDMRAAEMATSEFASQTFLSCLALVEEERSYTEALIVARDDLRNIDLSGDDLSGMYLAEKNFRDAEFHHADLTNTILRGANLTGADLRKSRLHGATLVGAALNHALLDKAAYDRTTRWPQSFHPRAEGAVMTKARDSDSSRDVCVALWRGLTSDSRERARSP